ncbi:conserved hypothetical protein (plasmid) [Rhodococcus jostii RHA1]|uniref:Stress-response A/B barrel domain-containing protein n=1 Tax=Rhodococcus jostii (strain RHA1) TaxID=101510 RepID=Q0RXC7_RHOJR|nr:Dabb family protein [Rhodococcus jostii]ABH00059.1 conserved hypothetical protein [Rhodococcus jostii RHA1]
MYRVTSLLHLMDGTDQLTRTATVTLLRSSAANIGAHRVLIEPTLPGVRNGGDILIHLQFDDVNHWNSVRSAFAAAVSAPVVQHIDQVEYEPGSLGVGADPSASVYRALLLSVTPGTSAELVRRFETELLRMPQFIESMSSWQLSEVLVAQGSSAWTHVWEQEFTDIDGLSGPYLAHPVHWAYVDKWFDPESPECIVRDRVCHSFCALDGALIGQVITGLTA